MGVIMIKFKMTNEGRMVYGVIVGVAFIAIGIIICAMIFLFGLFPSILLAFVVIIGAPTGFFLGWRNAERIERWLDSTEDGEP